MSVRPLLRACCAATLAASLSSCQIVGDGNGAWIFNAGDLGTVVTLSKSDSRGGIVGAATGNSGGTREVVMTDAGSVTRITAGGAILEGVVNNSQRHAEMWHGVGIVARAAVMGVAIALLLR